MCSSTRGPAIWPSLVTWPTSMTAAPERLASGSAPGRRRAPGSPCRARIRSTSVHMVWIESITTRRGVCALGRASRRCRRPRSRRPVAPAAPAKAEPLGAQPHLLHRLLAGDVDARGGRRARAPPAACSSSVDLPMPGSPPTSSTEPRTKPPPVTRSSSAMPEAVRGASSALAGQRMQRERAGPCAWAAGSGSRRVGAGRFPRRWCSTRRRIRTCPASGHRPRRSSGRRRTGHGGPWYGWGALQNREMARGAFPFSAPDSAVAAVLQERCWQPDRPGRMNRAIPRNAPPQRGDGDARNLSPLAASTPGGSAGRGGEHLVADGAAPARELVDGDAVADQGRIVAALCGALGQAVMSSAIRSMEMRPTTGQRRWQRPTAAATGCRLRLGAAGPRSSRRRSRPNDGDARAPRGRSRPRRSRRVRRARRGGRERCGP